MQFQKPVSHGRGLARARPARAHFSRRVLIQASSQMSVVITGASSGIGKATSLTLAKQGWQVFAGVRKPEDGAALQQLLTSNDQGGSITPIIIDVVKPDTIAKAAAQVKDALQGTPLVGLVNNAGKVTLAPLEYMPIEVFEDHLQVNLVGVLRVTQAFLPLMRSAGGWTPSLDAGNAPVGRRGRILNISSQSGTVGFPLFGGYCASKFGLEGLNDCLKLELADHNIDVICIKPGAIKSDIWSRAKGTSTQVMDSLPAQAVNLYGTLIEKMTRATKTAEEKGGSCEDIANLISKALTDEKPRDRYLYGSSATVQMVVRKLLPDRWWNPIVLNSIKKL